MSKPRLTHAELVALHERGDWARLWPIVEAMSRAAVSQMKGVRGPETRLTKDGHAHSTDLADNYSEARVACWKALLKWDRKHDLGSHIAGVSVNAVKNWWNSLAGRNRFGFFGVPSNPATGYAERPLVLHMDRELHHDNKAMAGHTAGGALPSDISTEETAEFADDTAEFADDTAELADDTARAAELDAALWKLKPDTVRQAMTAYQYATDRAGWVSAYAKREGVTPQTVRNWIKLGMAQLPGRFAF